MSGNIPAGVSVIAVPTWISAALHGSNGSRVLVTVSPSFSVLTAVVLVVDDPTGLVAAPIVSGAVAVIALLLLYTRSANRFAGSS